MDVKCHAFHILPHNNEPFVFHLDTKLILFPNVRNVQMRLDMGMDDDDDTMEMPPAVDENGEPLDDDMDDAHWFENEEFSCSYCGMLLKL